MLVEQANSQGEVKSYGFDLSFNRDRVVDGEGNVTRYERDRFGLTWAITDALTYTTIFSYDGHNNLAYTIDARSNKTSYEYDANNNLRKVINPPAVGGTTVYTYNPQGQATARSVE